MNPEYITLSNGQVVMYVDPLAEEEAEYIARTQRQVVEFRRYFRNYR